MLGAVILLGHRRNLTETESLALVKGTHEAYLTVRSSSGAAPLTNRGPELRARFLDCAVMETLHRLREKERKQPFRTVRGFFLEGRELYAGAGFRELDHVQVCVRSPRQVVGYFLPRST